MSEGIAKSAMRRWPWITLIAAILLVISPLGQDVLHGAFYSGEQLGRSLSQFLLEVFIAILAGLALVEWLVRFLWARRRAKRLIPAQTTASRADSKTES
jgi:hypothetical protein